MNLCSLVNQFIVFLKVTTLYRVHTSRWNRNGTTCIMRLRDANGRSIMWDISFQEIACEFAKNKIDVV